MKGALYISIIFFILSCQNKSGPVHSTDEYNYVLHPESTDTTCLQEIARAKLDSSNGKITFAFPMGLLSFNLRQEKYLRLLSEKYDISVSYEFIGCIVTKGQRQGCYGDYMDVIIARKFGSNFKDSLLKAADSLLVVNQDTVQYYLCDVRPQIPGHDDSETNVIAEIDPLLKAQLKSDEEGRYPFIDVGFYIDTSGRASCYSLDFFMDAGNESNRAFKSQLFKVALSELEAIDRWQPGEINGHKIPTEHNARVYFQ